MSICFELHIFCHRVLPPTVRTLSPVLVEWLGAVIFCCLLRGVSFVSTRIPFEARATFNDEGPACLNPS